MWVGQERRGVARVATPGGEAFCHTAGHGNYYTMSDLSTGGARLSGEPVKAPGEQMELVIFAGGIAQLSLKARVVRVLPDGLSMAMAFDEPDEHTLWQLEDLVASALIDDFRPTHWL